MNRLFALRLLKLTCFTSFLLLLFASNSFAVQIWNLDFGAGAGPSQKVGTAATGQTAADYWNYYTRDGAGGWLYYGEANNLKTASSTVTDVDVTVANAPGAWGFGSSDPMYGGFIYPWFGESAVVTVKALPVGSYDIYIYSPDAAFQLNVGATSYGAKNCQEATIVNPPVWQEGLQLVRYTGVQVATAGQDVVITVNPGVGGFATFSGLQIVECKPGWNLDFGAGAGPSQKVGFAATGQTTADYWNYYTRDGGGGWLYYGEANDLKTVNGTVTDVDVTVENAPGAWGCGSTDPMYDGYIYPWYSDSGVVTIKNLPIGVYELYVYSPDASFEMSIGAVNYGTKSCQDPLVQNPPVWQEGLQHVRYGAVQVTGVGQDVVLNINPGVSGYATISGLQITKSSLRQAVYDHFVRTTPGKSIDLWTTRTYPPSWPSVPPVLAWNPNSLIYGLNGFTAISQSWQGEGSPGQVAITALSRRHGYARGHGMGDDGEKTAWNGYKVWFCTADNTVVQATIGRAITRIGNGRDYTIFVFNEDLPASITPMPVMTSETLNNKYPVSANPPYVWYGTCQHGQMSAHASPFNTHNVFVGGDSGSPNMLPMPDGNLVMFGGRTTSAPSASMQTDMDTLSTFMGLNPANYQLNWYNFSSW